MVRTEPALPDSAFPVCAGPYGLGFAFGYEGAAPAVSDRTEGGQEFLSAFLGRITPVEAFLRVPSRSAETKRRRAAAASLATAAATAKRYAPWLCRTELGSTRTPGPMVELTAMRCT